MIMQGCVISYRTVVFFQISRNLSRSLLTSSNIYCGRVREPEAVWSIHWGLRSCRRLAAQWRLRCQKNDIVVIGNRKDIVCLRGTFVMILVLYREPESKQMLDPLGHAWQKWQCVGCLSYGRVTVNKHTLFGPLLRCLISDLGFQFWQFKRKKKHREPE